MNQIFRAIDAQTEKYTDFLCDICAFEARAKIFAAFLKEEQV